MNQFRLRISSNPNRSQSSVKQSIHSAQTLQLNTEKFSSVSQIPKLHVGIKTDVSKFTQFHSNSSKIERSSIRSPQKLSARYSEIVSLQQKNHSLTQQLAEAKAEISELEEFKVVMNKGGSRLNAFYKMEHDLMKIRPNMAHQSSLFEEQEFDTGSRQIDILKSQVQKQKRYINRLTKILQTSRVFYKELKDFLKYFAQVLFNSEVNGSLYNLPEDQNIFGKIEGVSKPDQQAGKLMDLEDSFDMKENLTGKAQKYVCFLDWQRPVVNEQDLTNKVEQKQQYISLKSLLKSFKSNEEKDSFVTNFGLAYQKVLEFERKNAEFSSVIELSRGKPGLRKITDNDRDLDKERIISIANRDQQSGDWYLKFTHPMRRFLHQFGKYFPIRQIFSCFPMKNREAMETMLVTVDGMCHGIQRSLAKLDTFSLFKANPYYFQESNGNLDIPIKLLEERWLLDKFLQSNVLIPQLSINQISKTAQSLQELLNQLLTQLQPNAQTSELWSTYYLRYNLIQSIEQLMTLGIVVGDTNQTQNRIQIVLDQLVAQEESKNVNLTKSLAIDKPKDGVNYAFFYDKSYQSNGDFTQKYQLLESIIGDLNASKKSISQDQLSLQIQRIFNLLRNIKYSYDLQYNLCKLREGEVHFIKQKMKNLESDIELIRESFRKAQTALGDFFGLIDHKLIDLNQSFQRFSENDNVADIKSKRLFQIHFKQSLRDISSWVKKFSELQHQDNTMNIRYLSDEFEKKVNLLFVKYQSTQTNMNNLMKSCLNDTKKE